MRELPRGAEPSAGGAVMMGTFHPSARRPAVRRSESRLARRRTPRTGTLGAPEAVPHPLSLAEMAGFLVQITPGTPRRPTTGSPAMSSGRMSEQIKAAPLTLQG